MTNGRSLTRKTYDLKSDAFSPAEAPKALEGATVLAVIPHGRFLIGHTTSKKRAIRVSVFDANTAKVIPNGWLTRGCVNIHWILSDGRVLFHYTPAWRWPACGGEIYDPAQGTSVAEPDALQHMNIIAQMNDDRFLVMPRPSPRQMMTPVDTPKEPLVSLYDLHSGDVHAPGEISGRLAYYNEHILLNDGRLLMIDTTTPGPLPGLGGRDEPSVVTVLDPSSGRITQPLTPAQPHGSGVFLTALSDGRILVAGGNGRNNAEILNPSLMTSSPTGPMIQCENNSGITLSDGRALFAGGTVDGLGFSAGASPHDWAQVYQVAQ
jgi:hypothetical protein